MSARRAGADPAGGAAAVARGVAVALACALGLALAAQISDCTPGADLSYAIVGAILVAARPANVVGGLVLGLAFTFVGTSNPTGNDVAALRAGSASLGTPAWNSASAWPETRRSTPTSCSRSCFRRQGPRRPLARPVHRPPRPRRPARRRAGVRPRCLRRHHPRHGERPQSLAVAPHHPGWRVLAALAGGVVPLLLMVVAGVVGMLARNARREASCGCSCAGCSPRWRSWRSPSSSG